MRRGFDAAIMLLVLALFMSACGATEDSADDTAGGSTTTSTTAPTTTTEPATTTSTEPTTTTSAPTTTTTVPEIEVIAFDYRFEGLPETVPVGTRISLINESTVEFHEVAVYKLDDSDPRTVEDFSQLPLEEWINTIGGVQTVIFAMPESPQYTFVEGPTSFRAPGRYLVFCGILVGTDPETARDAVTRGPMRAQDGVPRHYELGMMAEVVVEG